MFKTQNNTMCFCCEFFGLCKYVELVEKALPVFGDISMQCRLQKTKDALLAQKALEDKRELARQKRMLRLELEQKYDKDEKGGPTTFKCSRCGKDVPADKCEISEDISLDGETTEEVICFDCLEE